LNIEKLEVGNKKLEIRNKKLEAGNRKLEVRIENRRKPNKKLEVGSFVALYFIFYFSFFIYRDLVLVS